MYLVSSANVLAAPSAELKLEIRLSKYSWLMLQCPCVFSFNLPFALLISKQHFNTRKTWWNTHWIPGTLQGSAVPSYSDKPQLGVAQILKETQERMHRYERRLTFLSSQVCFCPSPFTSCLIGPAPGTVSSRTRGKEQGASTFYKPFFTQEASNFQAIEYSL